MGIGLHLSSRNKVFIAGIVGVVVLIVGLFVMMNDFSASQRALDAQFPGREKDGVPEGFGLAIAGILFTLSGIASGACYAVLDRAAGMRTVILRSAESGAAEGLLLFLAACALMALDTWGSGPVSAAVGLFTGAYEAAPYFIVIILALAAFGALGGAAAKLTIIGINKILKRKV